MIDIIYKAKRFLLPAKRRIQQRIDNRRFIKYGNPYRFKRIAEFYRGEGHYFYLHGMLPEEAFLQQTVGLSLEEWLSKDLAIEMLERYWIDDLEWAEEWQPRKDRVFQRLTLEEMWQAPEKAFPSDWSVKGYDVYEPFYDETAYERMRRCLLELGEKEMVMMEEYPEGPFPVRLRIPLSMSWSDILRGGYLLLSIMRQDYGNYMIFGRLPIWGRYVALESNNGLDLLGFDSEHASMFSFYEQDMDKGDIILKREEIVLSEQVFND